MKIFSVLGLALFCLTACHQNRLEKDEAASIIRSARNYPKAYEYEINMTDPASARRLIDAGLEEEGWVTVDKTQKLKDIGQPIVHFTDKAKPYLIRIDEKYDNIQVVKVADMDLGEVTGIQQGKNLANNLKKIRNNKKLSPFTYHDKGTLATIGRNKAVADIGKMHITGFFAWVIWLTVHLTFLMGFRNKLVVFINWMYSYFTYDRGTRILLKRH
jgi:hypothetical protein